MVDIPLARSDYHRSVAKEARIQLHNRYYEANPALTDTQVALIARPGLRRFLQVGDGPIRATYSQPGSFEGALFAVSADDLYKITATGAPALLGSGLQNIHTHGGISMVATSNIGTTPEFLFLADGRNLWVYIENGFASGTLTAAGAIVNNDVVRIGAVYYQWTNGSVNAGTPLGTLAFPWLVALGADNAQALGNLHDAIDASGVAGTTYSTALTINAEARTVQVTSTLLQVRATAVGILGNSVVTTETGANISWGAGTLTGGGAASFTTVQMPDDVGAISVGYIASHVVVVPAQGEGINGRFFWIEPGEIVIDPLNFATAERSPDPIFEVVVFGDQFWLPGQSTVEVWYFTGNLDAPVMRLQGITFDRGTWEGTAVQIKESMIITDADGGVFQISGGLKRISRPDIEERIRASILQQSIET